MNSPPALAHDFGGGGHEPGRDVGQAFVGEDRAHQHAGEGNAVLRETCDHGAQPVEMPSGGVRGSTASRRVLRESIGLRKRYGPDIAVVALRSRELADFGAVAVIRRVRADDAPSTGGQPRHHQGHFVGLGARAGEYDAVEARVMVPGEAFGVVQDAFVQVAAVDVERGRLPCDRLHHVRVAVAHARHVVVHVDVASARRRRSASRPRHGRCAPGLGRTAARPCLRFGLRRSRRVSGMALESIGVAQ